MKNVKDTTSFMTRDWVLLVLIIATGILLRWINLDVRPFHHDEALHAVYGNHVYNDPNLKFYRYNPLLHGPLLYNILPFFFQLFGSTKWAARSLVAILGTIFLLLPLLFRRYFCKNTLIFLTTFISLSPSLIYWSRFIRHDFLVITALLIMLWGFCYSKSKYKSFFILLGLSLHFCTKENVYITISILSGYMLFEFLFSVVSSPLLNLRDTLLIRTIRNIKTYPIPFGVSLFIAAFIFAYFFSAGFKYPTGITDGLFNKGISYWAKQHSIERIKGPFIFNFLILSWYDFLFIVLLFGQFIHFYYIKWTHKKTLNLTLIISTVVVAIICHLVFHGQTSLQGPILKFLKIKIPLDFYPYLLIPVHALLVTIHHLKMNNKVLAFWGFFFFGNFFTYSFVGEKVPWLAIYPLSSGLIYLALYFQNVNLTPDILKDGHYKLGFIVLVIVLFFNLRISLITNFANAGKNNELIGQVHTTETYEKIMLKIKDEILYPVGGKRPLIFADGHNTWPTTWYFYGIHQFSFASSVTNLDRYDYLLLKPNNFAIHVRKKMSKTHNNIRIPLRTWWVPDYSKINFLNFFLYTFSHVPWNKSGSSDIDFWVRKRNK